jgi:hypothetical protein
MDKLNPQLHCGPLELRLGLFISQQFVQIRLPSGLIGVVFIQIKALGKPVALDIPARAEASIAG